MNKEQLLNMEVHSKHNIMSNETSREYVLRVVGGWIYYRIDNFKLLGQNPTVTSTFVPEPSSFEPLFRVESKMRTEPFKKQIDEDSKKHKQLNFQIVTEWDRLGYDDNHRKNSAIKHLGNKNPNMCYSVERKLKYVNYLDSKGIPKIDWEDFEDRIIQSRIPFSILNPESRELVDKIIKLQDETK